MKVKVHKTFTDTRYLNSYDHNRACFGPDENYIIAGNGTFANLCSRLFNRVLENSEWCIPQAADIWTARRRGTLRCLPRCFGADVFCRFTWKFSGVEVIIYPNLMEYLLLQVFNVIASFVINTTVD
jgi:hypothetical protein